MINFTLLPSHSLGGGRGSVCTPNGSLYWKVVTSPGPTCGCSPELGCVGPGTWTRGLMCARAWSQGSEVFFLACILCGYMAMLLPVNEHWAGGSREGRLREEGLH